MDNINYTTEHIKGQHLLSEKRHEIEVRLKDGWSIYRIAKHLGRPYNTIKNEVKRGTVLLCNGKQKRYKADAGEHAYHEQPRKLPTSQLLFESVAISLLCRKVMTETLRQAND